VEIIGDKIVVTWKDGTKWEFKQSSKFWFYYSDTDWSKNKHSDKHVLLASTVKDNKFKFTLRDVSKANKARKQKPSYRSFPRDNTSGRLKATLFSTALYDHMTSK